MGCFRIHVQQEAGCTTQNHIEMERNLVIVESPAKTKTIGKYLDKNYDVMATYGHIRDLVPRDGAVEPKNDFNMNYEIRKDGLKHVNRICSAVRRAKRLYLATDPDREGEAIAWHLCQILREKNLLSGKEVYRVVFYEITRRAVRDAFANPRVVLDDLVNAQQARRALDHLVGFNLSPLLWRKIHANLSAGRVQSPALRLIAEREIEVENFQSQEYWSIDAILKKNGDEFPASLALVDARKLKQFDISGQSQAHDLKARLLSGGKAGVAVTKIDKKVRLRNPAPPFMTSTLQQDAVRKLGFSASKTMRVAQQLYEGVEIKGESLGLITYLRTDSVVIAHEAIMEIRDLIAADYGRGCLPEKPRKYRSRSKTAQEAHEAIRPTSVNRKPDSLLRVLDRDQQKLYEMIWKRTVACQMAPAILDTVSVELLCPEELVLKAGGSTVREPNFLLVYAEGRDRGEGPVGKKDEERKLPPLVKGEKLALKTVHANQHFTEPPPRFTEASLIKTLEEYGIGRPSTYASIISTLLNRKYVELEKKRFMPTSTGRVVNRFLTEHFERYVDYGFTAKLENELDEIACGDRNWRDVLRTFWSPFEDLLREKNGSVSRQEALNARELGNDPKTGRMLSARIGRYGAYLQLGTKDDVEKPSFASLPPGYKLETITFQEALELLKFPRKLGEMPSGDTIETNYGRFGPYVKYGKRYVSLGTGGDPGAVTLDEALALIAAKEKAERERVIQDFKNASIQVLKGRYGPYVTDGKTNVTVPKEMAPASLTLAACQKLLESKSSNWTHGSSKSRKSTKKTPRKKS